MYIASLTRLLRSVLAFECRGLNQNILLHHVCISNVMPLLAFSSVLANRSFSKTSSCQDKNVVNHSYRFKSFVRFRLVLFHKILH